MPASSTVRLTVTEFLADERCEFDTPITKRFVTDGNATLEKKFLRIAVTQVETLLFRYLMVKHVIWVKV